MKSNANRVTTTPIGHVCLWATTGLGSRCIKFYKNTEEMTVPDAEMETGPQLPTPERACELFCIYQVHL